MFYVTYNDPYLVININLLFTIGDYSNLVSFDNYVRSL